MGLRQWIAALVPGVRPAAGSLPEPTDPARLREHLDYLCRYASEASFVLGAGGRILSTNDRASRLYGWTREELAIRNIRDLMHPAVRPLLEQRWAAIRHKDEDLFESEHVHRDGRVFPVEVSVRCFRAGDAELRQAVVRDITARKQAEQRLQESLEQFRLLVDSVDGILWESDPHSLLVTFVNRRAEQVLGYPLERWYTEPGFWRTLVHPDDRETTIASFAEAESRLRPFQAEYRMVRADGRILWIRDIVMVTTREDGSVKLHGVMVDITEQRQIEAELQRARDFYFTVLDRLPDPVWQTSPEDRLCYVNEAWLAFTGADPAQALTAHWLAGLHPEDLPGCRERYLEAQAARAPVTLDYRVLHRDGTFHEVRNHGGPLVFNDQFMGYVGTLHDLQSLREAERDLLRVKDLYAALGQTDQLIIHAPDQASLFRDICTIATRQAKFTLAWVGLLDPATREVRVEAMEGTSPPPLGAFQVSARADLPTGRGPTGTCVREGIFQIVNEVAGDDTMAPWHGFVQQFGIRAAAAFPLWRRDQVVGALTLYSQQPGFFERDRVELLNEMAQDISFALDHFATEEERLAAERALRESEANLAKAQDLAQMGSWVWDAAGNHGQWSAGMEKIHGFPCGEGPGPFERMLDAVHPEDRVRFETLLRKLAASGGSLEADYRIRRPDGEERVFVVSARAERDGSGRATLIRGITQDITDRRRAEDQVRETLRRLEDLKSAVDEAAVVLVTDPAGSITYVNRRMCEITGYAPEELLGRNPRILGSHYHPKAFFRELWKTITAGGIWRGELKNRAKDGSHHWLDTTIVPFLDEGGNPVQYMAIRFDITALKQAEEQITAISSERMALLDAASVAKVVPWSLDLESGHLRMGDSSLLVLGKPALAFHAHPNALRELLKPEDQKLLVHAQAEARGGMLGTFEAPIKRGERQVIWTRWTIGRREGHLHGVVQDITEQHELQSQLLQSQKLESLGTLVGGITHDFNNILMGILGYTEVLSSMTELPQNVQKGIGIIGRAAERGRSLVNQLLRFSRRSVATKVLHNVNDIAREVRNLMQLPGDDRIALRLELEAGLPDILMDPGQLNQVAMNLAVNAKDAIAGRGSICFRTGRARLDPQEAAELDKRPGSYLFLEVEDTGVGIRPELIPRLFEPFFTTKGVGKGTGLGLSVVHGIVEAHGGLIQCESEPGQGTRFRVLLPEITSEAFAEGAQHPAATQKRHDLLLLDEPGPSRSVVADLLAYMGHRVVAELDVRKALEAHHQAAFQLAIVNLELDGARGARSLEALQEVLPDLPVIAGALQVPEGLKRQPQALVQWPFRGVELLAAIDRLLG